MKGLTLIVKDEIHDVVAMKKAALLNPPSGKIPQIKVANNARCNSVSIPPKFINNLSL
jgi:hypothetical protein